MAAGFILVLRMGEWGAIGIGASARNDCSNDLGSTQLRGKLQNQMECAKQSKESSISHVNII